jgi:hypothetical protein
VCIPVRHEGDFTTVDVPGASQTATMSINDHGEMVGFYFDEAWMVPLLERSPLRCSSPAAPSRGSTSAA